MKPKILLWVAITVFILGALLTVHAVRLTQPTSSAIEKKLATLAEVEQLADQHAQDWATVARFDELPQKSPRPLEVIASHVANSKPTIRTIGTRNVAGGWTLRTMSITFEDILLADLSSFIDNASADTERPPWILMECSITASDRTAGNGRAVLSMEALEKKSGTR